MRTHAHRTVGQRAKQEARSPYTKTYASRKGIIYAMAWAGQ
jgi:hypothetical protein